MKKPSKRILCVCAGGNVRSVALAYILKRIYNYDALSCGIKANSQYTLEYLYKWADRIVIMQDKFKVLIPNRFHPKIVTYDVGEDIWNDAKHPELIDKLYRCISRNKI